MKYWICMLLAGVISLPAWAEDEMVAESAVVEAVDAVAGDEDVSEEPGTSAPAVVMQPVALITFGDVDPALMERARLWAEENLAIPVPVLPAEPQVQVGSFDEAAEVAAKLLEPDRAGLVVLWRPTSDVMNHGALFPDSRIAIANLNPMLTADTEAEVIERRIERQVIRGICFVMGLEPNPNPMSAMFAYNSLEELDSIGRNLDPPWLMRLQQRAVEWGIPVNPDSPYNMGQ